MDDDIENIIKKEGEVNLKDLFGHGFAHCRLNKSTLWGIPLSENKFFMKDTISTTLKYIGAVYGVITTPDAKKIEVKQDQWEDFIFTMKHFKLNGVVVRFDGYGIKSKWYNPEGGLCSYLGGKTERMKMLNETAKEVLENYPKMCSLYLKAGDIPNLRLNYRYKNN